MSMKLNRPAYEQLIAEDLAWLTTQAPRTLEREHIAEVLRCSADHEYGDRQVAIEELTRTRAQLAAMREVLRKADQCLVKHHDSRLVTFWGECPVCGPARIFYDIEAALASVPK